MVPLYCNRCFRRQDLETNLMFYISRCAHVLCQKCARICCPLCGKNYNAYAVHEETPPHVLQYFQEPREGSRKYSQILRFQYEQERRWRLYLTSQNNSKTYQNSVGENSVERMTNSRIQCIMAQFVEQPRPRYRTQNIRSFPMTVNNDYTPRFPSPYQSISTNCNITGNSKQAHAQRRKPEVNLTSCSETKRAKISHR